MLGLRRGKNTWERAEYEIAEWQRNFACRLVGHFCVISDRLALIKAEMSALENTGRLPAVAYNGSTMYTSLSPCDMCKYFWYLPFQRPMSEVHVSAPETTSC